MSTRASKSIKLFPRNLTARADIVVRGNPVTSRPESGVENSFPGLEFDQRNLDKTFFPGLLFEMHHDYGVILRDFAADGPAAALVKRADLDSGVYLAYLQGTFASRVTGVAPEARVVRFTAPAGLASWRFVRDLELGEVAVVLCDTRTLDRVGNDALDIETVNGWLTRRRNRAVRVAGVGRFVLLFGDRARYLTDDGVIDPRRASPGDLTQSLCSPWQYDFADCGCFYWASNKPDLVSSDAQPNQVLNFQRVDRSAAADRATEAGDWLLKHDGEWDGDDQILRHGAMMSKWGDLPFVVAGRETDRYPLPAKAPTGARPARKLLKRAEIIDRLRRLAPVEHALAVEYLYAYYSLGLPARRPDNATARQSRIFTAGDQIFQVAIDEMRHLRSVNELLIELKQPWVLGRATVIGEDFDNDGIAFRRPFARSPLTRAQLDWFIDVEKASQTQGGDQNTIDGMYTLLVRSIEASGEFTDDEKARYAHLIKVIIDEGIDHYARFSDAKRVLAGIAEAAYLKVADPGEPQLLPAGTPDRLLQDVFDAAYLVVLRSLDYVFRLGDRQRGAMMESARRAMYNMDDAARSLADRRLGAVFDYARMGAIEVAAPPSGGAVPGGAAAPVGTDVAKGVGDPLRAALAQMQATPADANAGLAQRMQSRLDAMTREFEAAAQRSG
ncbi:MAG: ferritin-like domain-containing protein [Burkholderiales bacterium]